MQFVFVGGSALFFTAYLLVAEAFGFLGTSEITPAGVPESPDRGGILGAIDSVIQVFTFGFDLFARFFQLLTFQAPGLESASLVTALVFVPLGLANAWIIFRGIRG